MINYKKLELVAKKIRKNILTMSLDAQSAHTGGALSVVDILVALYFSEMKIFPNNPYHEDRDRLIFSKAHDAKALFATLAEAEFFDKKILSGYEKNDGLLPGHSTRFCVPGVEASAGSLGHGLSLSCGVAYAGMLNNKKFKVYSILSDGECNEGSTWEAILFAGHHKLSNLITIIDYNKLQGFGYTKDVLDLEPFADKWRAFNWNVIEINGHNFSEIISSIKKAKLNKISPTVILANTVKGIGGIKKHINEVSSQYKPPTLEEYIDLFGEEPKIL